MSREVTFGQRLKVFRADAKLSQDQLAKLAGVSWQCIALIEQGLRRDPKWSTVCRIAKALRVSVENFDALDG